MIFALVPIKRSDARQIGNAAVALMALPEQSFK
jgi:hypothetical protein